MDADGFPTYPMLEATEAKNDMRRLSADVQQVLSDVIWKLQDAPDGYPEQTSRIRSNGSPGLRVYRHPEPVIEVLYELDAENKVVRFLRYFVQVLPPRRTVFISYSHADRDKAIAIKRVLKALEAGGAIAFWDDTEIKAGEPWEKKIKEALASAKAAVLLVSQRFLESDFITKYELPTLLADAESKGKKILWIPISPSNVFETHAQITVFQSPLPNPRIPLGELSPTDQRKALRVLKQEIKTALSA